MTASTATRAGLGALGAGLVVGITADLLLPAEPWGLNMLLCVAALVAAGAWLVRRQAVTPSADAGWLALTALLLGAAFLRRDARMLQMLDVLALIVTFGLAAAAASGIALRRAPVGKYIAGVARSAASTFSGSFQLVFGDVAWREVSVGGRLTRFRGVALGALIAAPLLLVFGGLFASADPVFKQTIDSLLGVDLSTATAHVFRTGILGGLAAGYLRGIVLAPQPKESQPLSVEPTSARAVPVVTALVLLNALFLLFVAIQLRYFFGGAERVVTVAGLTFAEYARRGFFELVWATALVVPVLLGGDWAVRGAAAVGVRRFRVAATVTLGLLAVVMASALERMRLYVAAFGLTEDRLYATAAMLYFAILLAWLGWTVLRGRADRFAFGGTLQGLAVLAGLHTMNPDAFIARHNLDRPGAEQRFDAEYAATLSADAAPVLLRALPDLAGEDACVVARRLAGWTAHVPDGIAWTGDPSEFSSDWRTWNWARSRAARLGRDPLVAATVARCDAERSSPSPKPLTPNP